MNGDGRAEIILGDFARSYRPSINLADFLPLRVGDETLWVDADSFFVANEKITGTMTVGAHTAYKDDFTDCVGSLQQGRLAATEGG